MELWQLDITVGVTLADGTRLQVLTGIDDHSRFCVSAKVLVRPTVRPVCKAFAAAMRTHGVPEQVLTRQRQGVHRPVRHRHGGGAVRPDLPRQRHQTSAHGSAVADHDREGGAVLHKTLKGELLTGKTFDSIADAQAAIDAWVVHYNTARPHQGIGMVTPSERFRLAADRRQRARRGSAPVTRNLYRVVGRAASGR